MLFVALLFKSFFFLQIFRVFFIKNKENLAFFSLKWVMCKIKPIQIYAFVGE